MFSSLYNALLEWNRQTDDRQKLQHAYLFITILSVLIAGVVSLIDSKTGHDLLIITAAAGMILLVNAVLWALLESTMFARLAGRRKRQ